MKKHKHITEPDKHGFQVRIVRNGTEHSRYFSHKQWGSKEKSLQAAKSWRDQMLVALGPAKRYYKKPFKSKKSTGVCGVSRSVKYDARRDTSFIQYQCSWRKQGKPMNKTFTAGRLDKATPDRELHAFRTAVAFRQFYEYCLENNLDFCPDMFKSWKQERLYETLDFDQWAEQQAS